MRYSQSFLFTVREVPSEAEVVSHQLMLRAGCIKRLAAGIYSYLPLGLRVLRKIETIVREELDRAGAEELLMPAVQPAELWKESGRWQKYGPELLRFQDRHEREFCMGPTHEEVITDIVRHEIRSYRNLPRNLYQIQTKFRDEIRPRFGLMRGREFIMKDAYSFDADDAGATRSYQSMYDAYCRIFERCGLAFKAVEADSGQIGGSYSHEFMVLAHSGEDAVASCVSCSYGANIERAERKVQHSSLQSRPELQLQEIPTPGVQTIEDLATFLGLATSQLLKAVAFRCKDRDQLILAFVAGDREVNPVKLARLLDADIEAAPASLLEATGIPAGAIGPLDLPSDVRVVLDAGVTELEEIITGANRPEMHLRGIDPALLETCERDDIAEIRAGDSCPRCGGELEVLRGIEVGHVFKLGTLYSEAMNATFLDDQGRPQPLVMGCYGIGIGRTAAAAIEQNHDDRGIIWPMAIAPWQVILCSLNARKDEEVRKCADDLYERLGTIAEVLYDDRDERPGVKFTDAELIGIPLRLTVGRKMLDQGLVEITCRATAQTWTEPLEQIENIVRKLIDEHLQPAKG